MVQKRTGRDADEVSVIKAMSSQGRGNRKLSAAGREMLAEINARSEMDAERDGNPQPAPQAGGGGHEPGGSTPPPVPKPESGGIGEPVSGPADQPVAAPGPKPAGGHAHEGKGDGCCQALVVRLERIKILELTIPRSFKDNVVITGLSTGTVMQPSPTKFGWPLDSDQELDTQDMDKNDEELPTNRVAYVETGRDCMIALTCNLGFWEEDASEVGDLLEDAARQLTATLALQHGIVVPSVAGDLIRKIIRDLVKKLGFSDERMGEYTFDVSGRLTCDTQIDQLTWSPPWGQGYAHEKIDQRTARLKRTFGAHGGRWETSILVQILCPDCPQA